MTTAQRPPLPETFDAAAFRRELAGLRQPPADAGYDDFRDRAVDVAVCLVDLYNDAELDRKNVWGRIASGLASIAGRHLDGDLDLLVSELLEHVRADPVLVGPHETLPTLLKLFAGRPPEWRRGFAGYLAKRHYAVIGHAREAWEQIKSERSDARALRSGGATSAGEVVEVTE